MRPRLRLKLSLAALLLVALLTISPLRQMAIDWYQPVPILLYHRIAECPERQCLPLAEFERQMDYLATEGFHSLSMAEYWERRGALPPKPVVITFDDGYLDLFENALPILRLHGLKATLFVNPSAVSENGERRPAHPAMPGAPGLTWAELRQLEKAGVDVESHSQHHLRLPGLPAAQVEEELRASRAELEAHLGHPVYFLAYPYGSVSRSVAALAKAAGYKAALSVSVGGEGDFTLRRVSVGKGTPQARFERNVASWVARLRP